MLGITPQMIRDYRECSRRCEEVGVFPDCNKCSWVKLIVGDSHICENKETENAVREAEKTLCK